VTHPDFSDLRKEVRGFPSPVSLCDIPTSIFFVKAEGDSGRGKKMKSIVRFDTSIIKIPPAIKSITG
jgi:hypothetical protein